MADVQEDIACKGVCVNEKHSRDMEGCPARPYSSSGAGSRVVLRHRAAAAACLTVEIKMWTDAAKLTSM